MTPAARSFSCQATMRGISSLQGPHHAAQRLIHTHLPTPSTRLEGGASTPGAAAVLSPPLGAGRGDWPAQSWRGELAVCAVAVEVVAGAVAVSLAATTLARPVIDGGGGTAVLLSSHPTSAAAASAPAIRIAALFATPGP